MDLPKEEAKEMEAAEPYRFNFEIAWEVANKGRRAVRILAEPFVVPS